MVKWYYDPIFLEDMEWLYIVGLVIIVLTIIITIILVRRALNESH